MGRVGGGVRTGICGWRCLSRRTFKVRVNSSLLCSILEPALERIEYWDQSQHLQLEFLIYRTILLEAAFWRGYKVNSVVQCACEPCWKAGYWNTKMLNTEYFEDSA